MKANDNKIKWIMVFSSKQKSINKMKKYKTLVSLEKSGLNIRYKQMRFYCLSHLWVFFYAIQKFYIGKQ